MNTENGKKEMWVSEAQKEVWKWKEALYKETKHLSTAEMIQYINEKNKKLVEEIEAKRKVKEEALRNLA